MPPKTVKITSNLYTELNERKRHPSEALEDVIRREMHFPPRRELLTSE
jgi:predicted CopG family antitoxin